MLLFIYLCDNCDIAGFIEVNYKRWASDLNSSIETIQGACKGLIRGVLFSKDEQCIFIKNFLKHQKNYPLNPKNNCHEKIISRFNQYREIFDIHDVDEFIQGACKGLISPLGNGNGSGNGNIINWKSDFSIYLSECKSAYKEFNENTQLIKEQEKLNPQVNVLLSIEKGFRNFWGTEAGWNHKKKERIKTINWKRTIITSIDMNKVYYTKEQLSEMNK